MKNTYVTRHILKVFMTI